MKINRLRLDAETFFLCSPLILDILHNLNYFSTQLSTIKRIKIVVKSQHTIFFPVYAQIFFLLVNKQTIVVEFLLENLKEILINYFVFNLEKYRYDFLDLNTLSFEYIR